MRVQRDDPTRDPVMRLLQQHLADVAVHSPPESIHALGADALCSRAITFWSVVEAEEVIGCGALLELSALHGEVKSMRTDHAHLRKGVASAVLAEIIEESLRRGYARLSLETGSQRAFAPARALYSSFGFEVCGPFGEYAADPNSVFMTREL